MTRILHFADLHLDSSYAGVGMAVSEASRRREELRASLRRIVDLALEQEVDALTVGGDLYEHDRVTLDTGRFIASQFGRLAPRPVLIAPGNHDRYVPDSMYRRMDWPDNVHIFGSMEWGSAPIAGGVTVWGVGHNSPAVRENLLRDLRLERSPSTVALLHASDASSVPEEKAAHCPFEARDAESCGAGFILLGHYHRMRVWPSGSPRCGYPGSPEPLGFDEEGPHYVLLLTLGDGAPAVQTLKVNEVSYRTERLDVTGMSTSDLIREAIAAVAGESPPTPDIVRVLLEGQADADLDLDLDALLSATAEQFRYLDIVDDTRPAFDFAELAEETTTRGAFVRLIRGQIEGAEGPERQRLENALLYGLQAFAGHEVRRR
jgi:DNA repair exonuclease SbcCD nuclease subunit